MTFKDISEEEYNDWLKTSTIVEPERCSLSSCCGPHSFSTLIEKNGYLYELSWGWGMKHAINPEVPYAEKDYSISRLRLLPYHHGDGI